jgi:hypothetical protein
MLEEVHNKEVGAMIAKRLTVSTLLLPIMLVVVAVVFIPGCGDKDDTADKGNEGAGEQQGGEIAPELLGTWQQISLDGFGKKGNSGATSMAVYTDDLYVGAENGEAGCEAWRLEDGNWSQVNASGFGSPDEFMSMGMVSYKGGLYAGTDNWTSG